MFILNMPGIVAKMLEAKFKTEGLINLSNFNFAKLYQMTIELTQNHYRNQKLKKHIKKTSSSKYCNEKPNKYICHDSRTSWNHVVAKEKSIARRKKYWKP